MMTLYTYHAKDPRNFVDSSSLQCHQEYIVINQVVAPAKQV